MVKFVLSRVGQTLLVLWAAYTITFTILFVLPGDPIAIMLNAADIEVDFLSDAELTAIKAQYGLDQPMYAYYLKSLVGAVHGDFGMSLTQKQPVTGLILDRLPSTMSLAGTAVLVSVVVGAGFAYLATRSSFRPLRTLLARLPVFGVSLPTFWVGLLLVQVFAFSLGWLPATGQNGPRSLILPVITMSLPSGAVYAQVLIKGLEEGFRQPYAQAALSRGLTRGQVQGRYVFRNAALPVLTLLGLQVGNTVAGTIVIETVFTRNGIGRLAQEAVLAQDIPLVLGIVVLAAAAFVVVNLLVDLIYPFVDPRVRAEASSRSNRLSTL
ncbi:ABC transporter permease [Brooklawnia cerclae]|nr:ABC transporter permease [Brooklawnia cerclae]